MQCMCLFVLPLFKNCVFTLCFFIFWQRYDSHLITKQTVDVNNDLRNKKHIDAIPNSNQNMTCSIGDVIFCSLQFMKSSLEKLIKLLYVKTNKKIKCFLMRMHYNAHIDILCKKRCLTVWTGWWHQQIWLCRATTEKSDLYSLRKQVSLRYKEYDNAKQVHASLNCQSVKYYHLTC